jgi:MFS transporter, DHA2 family, multidrug resistance protein
MYKRGLYHDWVPKPLQLLLTLICSLPFVTLYGVYTNNIPDMMNSMGNTTELFTYSNYAGFIGMAITMPLIIRLKQYFRNKELTLGSLLILSLLCWICYSTDNTYLIAFSSFFIGVFRMIGMMEFLPVVFILISPSFDKTEFYPFYYPFIIAAGQLSGYYFSLLAYQLRWEQIHLLSIIYMLFSALLLIIFMHNSRESKKLPLYQFHWLSMILFAVMMLVLDYVLVYARYYGWFQSSEIRWALAAFFLMLVVFIVIQHMLKRPYLPLNCFKSKNVYASLIMTALLGIYLSSTNMQNTFMLSVLKYSSQTNCLVNLAMVPGVIAGGFICFVWFKRQWKLKGLVLIGFGCYLVAQIIMYFLYAPVVQVEYFIFPNLLKGCGLCLLYISLAIYCSIHLKRAEVLSVFSVLVMVRSFLGPALFGSILSWANYKLQWININNLASHIDAADSYAMARGGGAGLYQSVQIQSALLATRQLLGYTIIAGIIVMIYIGLLRFEPFNHRRALFISKRLRGHNMKGYRFSLEDEELAITEAAQVVV